MDKSLLMTLIKLKQISREEIIKIMKKVNIIDDLYNLNKFNHNEIKDAKNRVEKILDICHKNEIYIITF